MQHIVNNHRGDTYIVTYDAPQGAHMTQDLRMLIDILLDQGVHFTVRPANGGISQWENEGGN